MDSTSAALWQVVLSALNIVVLIATFITLVLYTKYTYQMQRAVKQQVTVAAAQTEELIHQRRLSVLPSFVVVPTEPKSSNRINLNNVGKGVAINVVIEDVAVKHISFPEARICFPPVSFIQQGQQIHPGLNYTGLGDRIQQNQAMNAPPIENFLNESEYTLTVRFLDIEGNGYQQALRMNQGRCTPSPVEAKISAD